MLVLLIQGIKFENLCTIALKLFAFKYAYQYVYIILLDHIGL